MIRPVLAAVLLFGVVGCATADQLKSISVGHTGCMENEMDVSEPDYSGTAVKWTVNCDGHVFLCSKVGHDIACHDRLDRVQAQR